MPFELRDISLAKPFFADALHGPGARTLLDAIRQRSQERLGALGEIQPAADAAKARGNLYPLLTLQMGIAFHQAMIDACDDFEQEHLWPDLPGAV